MEVDKDDLKHILDCKKYDCYFCNKKYVELFGEKTLKIEGTNRKFTNDKLKRAIEMRNNGFSYDKIAIELEVSKPTVYFHLKKYNR